MDRQREMLRNDRRAWFDPDAGRSPDSESGHYQIIDAVESYVDDLVSAQPLHPPGKEQ
jgi:hypothetical protein